MFNHESMVAAGLKPRHIHRILGVSRVTASNWLRGVTQPHHFLAKEVGVFTDAVDRAVTDGALPVPAALPPDEKSVRTVQIVRDYMAATQDQGNDTDSGTV